MKKSDLYYFANYFPDTKARHVQIAKMVDSFMDTPANVQMVLRKYKRGFKFDPREYYNLKNSFNITEIPSVKFLPIKYDIYFHLSLKSYLKNIINTGLRGKTFFYSRYGENSGCLTEIMIDTADRLSFRGVFAEIHTGKNLNTSKYVGRLDGIVVISGALKRKLMELGIDENKVLVAPSCVDLNSYMELASKNKLEFINKLSLPIDKNLVVYTGHLYEDRGIEELVESAKFLDDNTVVIIVGGLPKDVKRVRSQVNESGLSGKVIVLGNLPSSLIPSYQLSADVLVMPYSEKWQLKQWSSPMKMFEYMASKRPIVASDFPIIREVLNEKNSVLVRPGSAVDLAEGIKKYLGDASYSASTAQKAFEDVGEYTWEKRANRILEFMESF